MERNCEFCGVAKAVIYCQSDAAFLCLSCDARVHSANALSGRHYRDFLCDSCRDNTVSVRCIDHSMLLCRRCDSQLHDLFSHHKKLMLKSFTGCPSAQHFASLWGFNDQVGSESGRTSGQHKENNSLVLQQILNLKKLQVTESDKQSFPNFNSSTNAAFKEHGSFNRNLRSYENPIHALENEGFTLPISQLDHLSNSSLGGDLGSSQFWTQNLQDLGVCEDLGHFDGDLNIPEIDLSFRNFEELFANDVNVAHPLLKDSDLIWSQVTKAVSIDESESSHVNPTEVQDVADNGITFKEKTHISDNVALGTFRTMEELSQSFLSAESSGSDCLDSGHSEFVDSSRQM